MNQRRIKRILAMSLAVLPGLLVALLLSQTPAAAQPSGGTVNNCSNDSQLDSLLAGGGSITFSCGPNPVTITVSGWQTITLATAIDGGGRVTLNGAGARGFFVVLTDTSLSLANLTLYDGYVLEGSGGAVQDLGHLTLSNVRVVSNTAYTAGVFNPVGAGGAIFVDTSGTANIANSVFIRNQANGYFGGGALVSNGALTVTGSTFHDNSAIHGAGGAVDADFGTALIDSSTFTSNKALQGDGGALAGFAALHVTLTVKNSTFLSNTAFNSRGGAIFAQKADPLMVTGSTFAHNAANVGGAVAGHGVTATTYISDTFDSNSAVNDFSGGGAIDNNSGAVTVQASTFNGNQSPNTGGAISNYNGPLILTNSTLYHNQALYGSAIYNQGALTITSSTLYSNTFSSYYRSGTLDGSATLIDTILANIGVTSTTNNCEDGVFISLGHNLDSGNTCGLNASGDISDTDPLLGTLANNGGPTLTLLPAAGSPAVNHGGLICPAIDQRGVARPQNGVCDIGAVERVVITVLNHFLRLPLVLR